MTKKYILKIALIYVATILGAGFSSGKELINFFGFYKTGYIGFFISCILLGFIGSAILNAIYLSKAKTYKDFMQETFSFLGSFLTYFNLAFVFVLFSSMLAGGSEVLSSIFLLDFRICVFIFSFVIFIFLNLNKKLILNINTILCPILIIGSILVGLYLNFYTNTVFNNTSKIVTYPFIYASYNAITTISILFALKGFIVNKRIVFYSGVLSSIFVFIIGIFLLLPLIKNYKILKDLALPILFLLDNNAIFGIIYSIVIFIAIFTTAISNGFALCENLKLKAILQKAFLCILGGGFALCSFSSIVGIVYPIFGFIGLFEILIIVLTPFIKK